MINNKDPDPDSDPKFRIYRSGSWMPIYFRSTGSGSTTLLFVLLRESQLHEAVVPGHTGQEALVILRHFHPVQLRRLQHAVYNLCPRHEGTVIRQILYNLKKAVDFYLLPNPMKRHCFKSMSLFNFFESLIKKSKDPGCQLNTDKSRSGSTMVCIYFQRKSQHTNRQHDHVH